MTQLLTPEQLAERMQVSSRQLTFWRNQGRGPAFIRVGATIRYRLADVEAFEQSSREGGITNGHQKTQRQVALPVPILWGELQRKHRFGGHRTKSESREGIRS